MSGKTRILSIDGGGIRGIIPGQILVSVEEKLKDFTNNDDARLSDYFDLFAGTSTGGILTCIYLAPETPGDTESRPRFTAQDALELYLERGDEIFNISLWQKITSGAGILDEKYDQSELEEALDDYLDDIRLSHLIKPCLITAYDIKRRNMKFFTQHDAKKEKKSDFFIKEVARATSAAPTFFEPARIKSFANIPFPLIDGGVCANNPALCAYAEARKKLEGNPTARDMVILSLGTGYIKTHYDYKSAKDWGALEWIKPLIDIMMSGHAETVDYQLKMIFESVGASQQYLRINSDLEFAKPDMDDASRSNMANLQKDGARMAADFDAEINDFIKLLIE